MEEPEYQEEVDDVPPLLSENSHLLNDHNLEEVSQPIIISSQKKLLFFVVVVV